MTRTENNGPCGNCEAGVYCEEVMTSIVADQLRSTEKNQRRFKLPKCQTLNRLCIGAIDFCNAIERNPEDATAVD